MMSVREWLRELHLERHADAFEAQEIDLETLPELSDADLKDMGLPIGPRRKVLKAIRESGSELRLIDQAQVAPLVTTHALAAERRQLTVLFCDLVGSTALSERLDPEDLSGLMRAYRKACTDVIERYDGHVAQYLGDGVMVYFGWPAAHEDDARRAVRAGLEIVDAVAALEAPEHLEARIGIATGLVVVGKTDPEGAADAALAVGETPNVAARVQGLAEPGSVAITQSTRRLLGDVFALDDLGTHAAKGVSGGVHVYRVVRTQDIDERFEAQREDGLTPLVGRDEEAGLLLRRWGQAADGEGQIVLLRGEPGIGKSRIVHALRQRLKDEPHILLRFQCSPYHTNSAFYPIAVQIEQGAGFKREDDDAIKLDKLEAFLERESLADPTTALLFAEMMSLPTERYSIVDMSPQKQKMLTIAALSKRLADLAASRPVLLIFEDAHWIDATTMEVLSEFVHTIENARVLAVITHRPDFEPPWNSRAHVTNLTLSRLSRRHGIDLVAKLTGGKSLPKEVLDQIVTKTEGVPIFVEELTKTILEAGFLTDVGGHYELDGALPSLALPMTLQDSLMARLDRLGPVKEIAQIGACIGREFSYELLAAVSCSSDRELGAALDRLVDRELIFGRGTPPEASYRFKHALVRDAAYNSLLKTRRQQLHAEVAERLEQMLTTETESAPELLAYHFGLAKMYEKAVYYWRRAGEAAAKRAANTEASMHFTQALEIVRAQQDRFDDRLELAVLCDLGPALLAAKGWSAAEVGEVYERALEIARKDGELADVIPPLVGLWVYRFSRAELQATHDLHVELLSIARQLDDPDLHLQAHHAAWPSPMVRGDLTTARDHIEKGLALYDHQRHRDHAFIYMGHDPAVCGHAQNSIVTWALGFPETAAENADAALALARRLEHPPTVMHALWLVCKFRVACGDVAATLALADELLTLCEGHHLVAPPFFASRAFKGWALARLGDVGAGISLMEAALADWRATGCRVYLPHRMSLLADAYLLAGDSGRATELVDQASYIADVTGDRFCDAKLHMLRAEIALRIDPSAFSTAEEHLNIALATGRQQQAKAWELRAATSLARLWQQRGKQPEARQLLSEIYDWFTEGFDTKDLRDAKVMLEELE